MVFTLNECGFLQKSGAGDSYRLGPAVIALGYTARAGMTFLSSAEPVMQKLADEVGALVALAIRHGNAAMLTRCWRPRRTPAIWLSEGHRLPLQHSAAGRVIQAVSGQVPDDSATRAADIAYLQSHGFLLSTGGWNAEINACAVPFRPVPGEEAMAFLCGARNDEMSPGRLEGEVAPRLLAAVRQLEASMGLPVAGLA
jgi:DNA-binding IclR family transcriptional regulator